MSLPHPYKVGQYCCHSQKFVHRRDINGKQYLFGIAGSYQAYNLVSNELNGIFVLDEEASQVVLDLHKQEPGSWFSEPPWEQQRELERIRGLDDYEFLEFMRHNEMTREAYLEDFETA